VDADFLRWLAGLSYLADGPRLACGALLEKGIAVIIEPRLDGTHLDGSALLGAGGRPVRGLISICAAGGQGVTAILEA
jgi:hypothetical protein